MSKQSTKTFIADTFHENVRAASYSEIRIAGLIEQCGISRTTFYYHFTGKLDIATWIFRHDMASLLRNALPESKLVFAPLEGCEGLPLYVHNEIGARALDASEFFKALCLCVCNDRSFYHGLVANGNREFLDELYRLYIPLAQADVKFMLGGRNAPDSTKNLLASMMANIAVDLFEYAIAHPDEMLSVVRDEKEAFWNGPCEMVRAIIESRPTRQNYWQPYPMHAI